MGAWLTQRGGFTPGWLMSSMDGKMPKSTGAERRLSERVLVDLEVDYRQDDTFLFAYITDISTMGIFVRTTTPEPPGTRFNLRFSSPRMSSLAATLSKVSGARGGGRWVESDEQEWLELEGEVIWVNAFRGDSTDNPNPGMGIQFVDLTEEQRERIVQLVRTFAYLAKPEDDDQTTTH
jgi:type IV pilus assembly protein PilZ